jgi:hypothetical protein
MSFELWNNGGEGVEVATFNWRRRVLFIPPQELKPLLVHLDRYLMCEHRSLWCVEFLSQLGRSLHPGRTEVSGPREPGNHQHQNLRT